MADMTVNGTDISAYNGASLLDYVIGQTPITNTIFQGVNNSQWTHLFSEFGLREIYITIVFSGPTLRAAKYARSRFNLQVYSECELYIPDDGFYYRCSCMELGDEELVGIGDDEAQIKSRYHFQGIRHGELDTKAQTSIGGDVQFTCTATAPKTACRLEVPVAVGETTMQITHRVDGVALATVRLSDLPGDTTYTAVIDGLARTVTVGTNWLAKTVWTGAPSPYFYIVPGINKFEIVTYGATASERTVTLKYYPVYL